MAAVSSTAPAQLRVTLRCDFPAKRVAVTLPGATTLAQLLDQASELLDLERDVLARYSVRAAGLGVDVLQLVEGGTAPASVLAKSLLELEVADQYQLLFFAPIDVKPARKKRGKDGVLIDAKVAGDDAKFAGLTPSNVLPKLRLAKGKTKATLLQYVERTWADIVKTQRRELLALPKAGLLEILQLDELDCKEPELFALTLEWGKQEAKRLGVTPSGDDLKKILSDLVPHIRFPLFTASEMALMVTPTRILTSEQELHVYTHIGKVSAKKAPEVKDEKKGGKRVYVRVGTFIANPRQPFGVFRPATARFEDNTGIFYWLGTNEGKAGAPFVNPIEVEVLARASTLVGTLASLMDRNYTSSPVENSYGSDSAPWLEFEFKRFKVRPTAYFLAQEQDHYARNWRVEGSDDGSSWTSIREHVADSTLSTTRRWSFFDLKTDKFFRRLRLQLTGPSHQGSINWDVTEVEWYGYITPFTPA